MTKDKLNVIFISVIMVFSVINGLIFLEVIPFYVWRICNTIAILFSTVLMVRDSKNKNKVKDKKMTRISFITLFVWVITTFATIFRYK